MTETPWFPGHIKPVHFGVYKSRSPTGYVSFSLWSGGLWRTGTDTAEHAAKMLQPSPWQDDQWRGLTEQPK